MNYPLLDQLRNSIEVMKNRLIAEHPERFLGYKLSMKSQKQWAAQEEKERRRKAVVAKARAMIEWAHTEYEREKNNHKHNLKIFSLLTLNWSPQRVLSKHKDFKRLCAALKDDKTWRMLSRKERAFIADAVNR